jgi:pimeloyl-ACP methyl ester carboxylesterase
LGRERFILVGHSFGGAVVLDAAGRAPDVIAVAALSSQTAGVGDIAALSPRRCCSCTGRPESLREGFRR